MIKSKNNSEAAGGQNGGRVVVITECLPLMLVVQSDRTVYARVRAVTKHIVTTGDGQMSTKGQLRNV